MLVDDDDNLRETTAKLLAAIMGVEVVSFPSGAAALNALAAAPDTFSLVVSDLDMPGMSGIEFCRQLHLIQPRLPALLVTGSGVITADEARAHGFCGFMPKPFSLAALRHALAARLNTQQTNQAKSALVCLAA